MRISIMIAVYHEAELLGDMIQKLLANDFPDQEILVAVDGELTPDIETALEPFRAKIKIFYNRERLGKVNSLNRLYCHSNGDGLLFLDNDVKLPDDPDYLQKLHQKLHEYDIVEIPKEAITNNFLSRIVGYDFLSSAIFNLSVAKIFRKNLFLNGAAFAIKRNAFEELGGFPKLVVEDWGLMTQAFGHGKSYAFPIELKVQNSVPTTVAGWLEQRKRWALGAYQYWRNQITRNLKTTLKGLPILLTVFLLSLIPSFVALLFWKLSFYNQLIYLVLLLLPRQLSVPWFTFFIISGFTSFFQGSVAGVLMFFVSYLIYLLFARILRFRIRFFEFLIYYLFYFPILVFFNLLVLIGLGFSIWQPRFDWKV